MSTEQSAPSGPVDSPEQLGPVEPVHELNCYRLCQALEQDLKLLAGVKDLPPKSQAPIRALLERDIAGIRAFLLKNNCPACPGF